MEPLKAEPPQEIFGGSFTPILTRCVWMSRVTKNKQNDFESEARPSRMDLAWTFHRLEALWAPQKPAEAEAETSESPCSSCSLAQSSWTLSVSSSWKPEVEEADLKKF